MSKNDINNDMPMQPAFFGYSYPADGKVDLGEWSWSTSDNKLGIEANDGHSNTIITTTDGTGIGDISGDSIWIGDPMDNPNYIGDPNLGKLTFGNPNYGGITVQPSTCSTTFSIGYNENDKYAVMELPREGELPTSVFVSGRMLTLGILGTDVECAFTGDKLVFEPGAVSAISYGKRITISVEYQDAIYHYNVGSNGMVEYLPNSSTLVVTLVSTIKKDGNLVGAK